MSYVSLRVTMTLDFLNEWVYTAKRVKCTFSYDDIDRRVLPFSHPRLTSGVGFLYLLLWFVLVYWLDGDRALT